MSYPHFYGASESYMKYPIGLNPSKEKHETFMLLEPVSIAALICSLYIVMGMYSDVTICCQKQSQTADL